MKRLALWFLLCGVPVLARAQEPLAPDAPQEEPGRAVEPEPAVEEKPAAPPAEETPPAADPTPSPSDGRAVEAPKAEGDTGDRVVGTRPSTPGKTVPRPPPPPPKPRATVQRDKDGKVIPPSPARPLPDLVAPNRSGMSSVQRAFLTGGQVFWGAVFGSGAFVCGLCACPPMLLASVFGGPLIGAVAMGLFALVMAPLHVGMATLGLFVPAYFRDPDWLAAAAALAGVAAVDLLAVMLGGLAATAIVLRWAPSPSNSLIAVRGPVPAPAVFPELRGTDLALALNVLAVTGVMVFVAPLVGVALYTLVGVLRGDPAPEPAKVDTPRPAPRPADETPRRRRRRPRSSP